MSIRTKDLGDEPTIKDVAARKRTKFMTNSKEIASELKRKCRGEHAHGHLMGKRAQEAAIYPEALCKAICRGLLKEMRNSTLKVKPLMSIRHYDNVGEDKGAVSHEEAGEGSQAWDDVTGGMLNPRKVVKARMVEMGYVEQKGVWKKMLRSEAVRRGIRIVGTRWLDINKGDEVEENYRSRLVAKDFNMGKEEGLFAATPPLEALKLLISDAATVGGGGREEKIVMINDVARAFFEADMRKEMCVELPAEGEVEGEGGMVGYLMKSLYGTRDAAANFRRR